MDQTTTFREAVRQRRAVLRQPASSAEILPYTPKRSAFGEEARVLLQKIYTTAKYMQQSQAALARDGQLQGMAETEYDEIDQETKRALELCDERIGKLKETEEEDNSDQARAPQVMAHRKATLTFLQGRLQHVAGIYDKHRRYRLQCATEASSQRLGSAAATTGSFEQGGTLAPSGEHRTTLLSRLGGASSLGRSDAKGADGVLLEWADDELVADDEFDESERSQLQEDNEALRKELETMVQQTREAESRMVEIANLSHLFATKVDQQGAGVETLFTQAEQTSENLVRGNAYLDQAAKHSRDFRLFVLVLLLVASFSLLFLDWFYP